MHRYREETAPPPATSCPVTTPHPPAPWQIKTASSSATAGGSVPFVVGGENPSAGRVVTIFGLPDAGRPPLLVVESGAGGHCRGFQCFLALAEQRWRFSAEAAGRTALKGARTHTASMAGMLGAEGIMGGGGGGRDDALIT